MNNNLHSYPKMNMIIALVGILSLTTVFGLTPGSRESERVDLPVTLAVTPAANEVEPAQSPEINPAVDVEEKTATDWHSVPVRKGDSLSRIFQRLGLSAAELHQVMALGDEVEQLRKIIPGHNILLNLSGDGRLLQLRYEQGPFESLLVARDGKKFKAEHRVRKPEVFTTWREAEITSENPSLFEAGKAAGLSDATIMEMSYIFQWDISFALDLREGDYFSLMFQEEFLQGEKVGDGQILAASFTNLGKTHRAVLYTSAAGERSYYAPDGKNMRKAFIRDPIHFSRVSSSFNPRRLHPIHKRVMPHRGIDYVAKRGTPVVASGNGTVSIARQNAASGKYVVIQHGEQYTTKYLHLSSFARGIRPGRKVEQGEVIGYVGSTGLATAPHLHYEFLVNGVHRNPRTVKLPKAKPIPVAETERFVSQTTPYLSHLQNLATTNLGVFAGE